MRGCGDSMWSGKGETFIHGQPSRRRDCGLSALRGSRHDGRGDAQASRRSRTDKRGSVTRAANTYCKGEGVLMVGIGSPAERSLTAGLDGDEEPLSSHQGRLCFSFELNVTRRSCWGVQVSLGDVPAIVMLDRAALSASGYSSTRSLYLSRRPERAAALGRHGQDSSKLQHTRTCWPNRFATASGIFYLFAQLPLFLLDLEFQPLNTVLERLLPLPDDLGAQLRLLAQPRAAAARPAFLALAVGCRRVGARRLGQAALLQLGARLEGLDAAVDAVDVGVGAVEEDRDGGADFVAEGCLGGGERRLGDELVVLEREAVSAAIGRGW